MLHTIVGYGLSFAAGLAVGVIWRNAITADVHQELGALRQSVNSGLKTAHEKLDALIGKKSAGG